eukprot:3829381-Amphidinium_carterae.1
MLPLPFPKKWQGNIFSYLYRYLTGQNLEGINLELIQKGGPRTEPLWMQPLVVATYYVSCHLAVWAGGQNYLNVST